jgi:hypothetical protein
MEGAITDMDGKLSQAVTNGTVANAVLPSCQTLTVAATVSIWMTPATLGLLRRPAVSALGAEKYPAKDSD